MKKLNYLLASSTAALLLTGAPMLASAHEANISGDASARINAHAGLGVIASLFNRHDDNDGDEDKDNTSRENTRPSSDMEAAVGVVTSINGSTFTIKPLGHKATTTVSTTASTTYRVQGQATTSSALQVGSHVALIGTSTAQANLEASVVSIFTKGWGFFRHLLRLH